jgi:hypothetical protein
MSRLAAKRASPHDEASRYRWVHPDEVDKPIYAPSQLAYLRHSGAETPWLSQRLSHQTIGFMSLSKHAFLGLGWCLSVSRDKTQLLTHSAL